MNDTLVKVDNLSKKFCRDLKRSLWYGLKDLGDELLGRSHSSDGRLRKDEFWAVKDISFRLHRGECLGLIGKNGAGKSTLLKMLNGLIIPSEGRIELKGRVGALIELGAGFNPILTGRENIYVNGAVLGLSTKEIRRKFDEIVDFAEMEEFLDTPVQNYSSGMRVRLGFAVASHMDPDILLIDEVLAVGDVGFRAKCFNTINNMIERTAVILVTHSMPKASRVCSDILVMDRGVNVFNGKDVAGGIDCYYRQFNVGEERVGGSGKAIIHDVELESNGVMGIDTVEHLDDLVLHLDTTIDGEIKTPNISVLFINQEMQDVAQCSSYFNEQSFYNQGERWRISLTLRKINLNPGRYSIGIAIHGKTRIEILARYQNIKVFWVRGKHVGFAPVQFQGEWNFTKAIDT